MKRRDLFTLSLALAAIPAVAVAGGPSGGGGDQPSYTRMATLTATLIRSNGRRGVLSVEAGIDVPDEDMRTRAIQAVPRLRAAYADILRNFGAALRPAEVPDADRLARELQAITDETLGRGGARLLLGTILTS
jgi:hypothetical protein